MQSREVTGKMFRAESTRCSCPLATIYDHVPTESINHTPLKAPLVPLCSSSGKPGSHLYEQKPCFTFTVNLQLRLQLFTGAAAALRMSHLNQAPLLLFPKSSTKTLAANDQKTEWDSFVNADKKLFLLSVTVFLELTGSTCILHTSCSLTFTLWSWQTQTFAFMYSPKVIFPLI